MTVVVSGRRGQELFNGAISPPMRGLIEGLPTPRPIGAELPAALQEDEFCQRMMSAFDEVLAPLFTTLDCFESYLDPDLAPYDFVDWMASWVGVDIDETWTLERRRRLIREAIFLYRSRGTAAGLASHVELYAGISPEIADSGGCEWSQTAGGAMPGSPTPGLTVRLRVEDLADVRYATVNRIVAASRPAHIPYQLEVLVRGAAVEGPDEDVAAEPAAAEAPGAVDLPGSERIELAPQAPPSQAELDDSIDSSPDDSEPTT
jgi:phage tail-like protein